MKRGAPNSRDIAELAGVSQATVSRALRNSPLVRRETRERVQRIARELNYYVNRNAAGLRSHQSSTIALLLFDDEAEGSDSQMNLFLLSMLNNIVRCAARRGYDVLLSLQQLRNDWHIEYQASHRADGLIVLGYGDYVEYRNMLDSLVAANTRFVIWGPMRDDQPGHSIGCNNASGAYQATRHLIETGRKNIAFIGSRGRSPEISARYDGYVSALQEAGRCPNEALRASAVNSESLGYTATMKLIAGGHSFDAIFCTTDLIAIGAIRALQNSGRNVPRDVAVVGFDDMPLAANVSPALTTVRQDAQLGAEKLVESVVGLIEGESVESQVLEPVLVVRESCGARR